MPNATDRLRRAVRRVYPEALCHRWRWFGWSGDVGYGVLVGESPHADKYGWLSTDEPSALDAWRAAAKKLGLEDD